LTPVTLQFVADEGVVRLKATVLATFHFIGIQQKRAVGSAASGSDESDLA
jgi:hypothetical protein